MSVQEFSREFDILYNNIMSDQFPDVNEYEKSIFLSKAQEEIVKNFLNIKGNKYGEDINNSPKRQIDLSKLTTHVSLGKDTSVQGTHFNNSSIRFKFPDDVLTVLNESVRVIRSDVYKSLVVIPISSQEYDKYMNKPYQYPLKNQAWRLLTTDDYNKTYVELIVGPHDNTTNSAYSIRYIRKPHPIILFPLEETSINGYIGADADGNPVMEGGVATQGLSSELDSELHSEILQRAVEIAKITYVGDINSQIQIGQRSE